MSIVTDERLHGPYTVRAIRIDGALRSVYLISGMSSVRLKPGLESLRALRHAADLIDQSLAFDGCERPVDPERKETP